MLYWNDIKDEYVLALGIDIVNKEFARRYFDKLEEALKEVP